jgi:hypothetical protein
MFTPYALNQTMLDRIPMSVFHMVGKIPLVTDQVFPITILPDRSLSFYSAAFCQVLVIAEHLFASLRDSCFDQPPSCGEIGIDWR